MRVFVNDPSDNATRHPPSTETPELSVIRDGLLAAKDRINQINDRIATINADLFGGDCQNGPTVLPEKAGARAGMIPTIIDQIEDIHNTITVTGALVIRLGHIV